jgi:hypothetical protein
LVTTAEWYREFGLREARGSSPAYERLAFAVAEDAELLAMLDTLPEAKRQPNLLFAATQYLDGPVQPWTRFRDWALRHWDELTALMCQRLTQTNEPGRCAPLLPVLAQLPQPLALLEVGASAGLCLYPDAYRYRYDGRLVGPADSPVHIDCTELAALAARAPADATLVVFHTSVLAYVSQAGRQTFTEVVQSLPARWISNEVPGVLPDLVGPPAPTGERLTTRLALDGQVLAHAGPHGQTLDWL